MPRSKILTSPPPYSPSGIQPSKSSVLDRVVLRADGEARSPGDVGSPFGTAHEHRHAVALETQVVVQPRGVVLLDHESIAGGLRVTDGCGSGVTSNSRLAS